MTEVQTNPGSAPAAALPAPFGLPKALAYIGAATLIALTQGLAQGFVSTNIPQLAGHLGVTATQATWLMVAFMIPRASLPLLLIKIRTQYGLRRFAEVAIVVYVLLAVAALAVTDLRSAMVMQFLAGAASAPLSTLAFMYMLEPLSPQWKMRLGLPMVLAMISAGPLLARVVSPSLLADGGWTAMHVLTLGMAAVSLALVYLLPLASPPRQKVIAPLDLVSWLLIALGFCGMTVVFTLGATYWWTDIPWLGWTLAGSISALTLAVVIELNRKAPLLDIRWLASPAILHLTVTLLLFRLILSEQSAGAPRMFQLLGVTQDQLVGLFGLMSVATVLGGLALVPVIKPERVPLLHLIALVLIAMGAWMDSFATIDTRPAQMMLSQSMIAFAGVFFLAPALMRGLVAALAKGPNYLLSFVIVFLSTQTIGGVMGSGLFGTFITHREAAHLQILREELTPYAAQVQAEIAGRAAALAPQIADGAARRAQALASIAQDATSQAYVMAYNDAYRLTALVAVAVMALLLLHLFRDWLAARLWPVPDAAEAAAPPSVPLPEPSR